MIRKLKLDRIDPDPALLKSTDMMLRAKETLWFASTYNLVEDINKLEYHSCTMSLNNV